VNDLAAIAAYGIGNLNANGTLVGPAYYAAHALLGCASSAGLGTGCGGGAIGGIASAALTPLMLGAIDPAGTPLTMDAGLQSAVSSFAGLVGGGLAGALGQNVQGGKMAAQNEALNNSGPHWEMHSPVQEAAEEERKVLSHMNASAGLSRSEVVGYDSEGNPLTVLTVPPPMWGSGKSLKSGVPGEDFTPNPNITAPYSRPAGAGPTTAQRAAVQGQPCVDCGAVTNNQVADHKVPLVVQYYQEGSVNVPAQSSVDAVQPHCPTCSATQGGQLGAFGKRMRKFFGF
ncbi:hypothetical protein Q3O87_25275, partial [Ralstonia pseudosolanacearum]|nr:hypothetical protein [Ralstonia pseudosolanacearum]